MSDSITVLPNPNSDPTGLTIGPDNNLWFTEYYGNRAHGVIGRITLDGNITEFDLPNPGSGPFGGTLAIPSAGLTVVVPPFAVSSPLTITITA